MISNFALQRDFTMSNVCTVRCVILGLTRPTTFESSPYTPCSLTDGKRTCGSIAGEFITMKCCGHKMVMCQPCYNDGFKCGSCGVVKKSEQSF